MSVTTISPEPPALPARQPAGRELELKFLLTEPTFKATQSWLLPTDGAKPVPARRQRSVYFDTANGDLRRRNFVLRLRAEGRRRMLAVKWAEPFAGNPFERGEIEVPTRLDAPDLSLLGPDMAARLQEICKDEGLAAIYATDIRRATHRIVTATSDIEIAFDSGFIIAGLAKLPVREIELELKSGDPADLYRLGINLAERFPVRLGAQTKSERGAHLAAGSNPLPRRAAAALSGAPAADEVIGLLINGCVAQFIGNWPAFESGDGVAAVHQMRVAMRRLRAMLGLFNRAFPCAEFALFRVAAKRVASGMGDARNWDVFLELLRQGPMAAFPGEAGLGAMDAQAEALRQAAYGQVRALLGSSETTRFVLSLQAFIARRGWRNGLDAEALARLTAPAKEFAAANLARLHNRVLKRGRNLLDLPPHERHELRIDLKKLRYAADLFGGLFPGRAAVRDYTKAAGGLQDQLGLFNDLIVADEMVARLSGRDGRAAGMVMGWCARGAVASDDALAAAWKKFRKTKVFADRG